MKIINVVGARPNMMKIAPIVAAMEQTDGIEQLLLHTGQHYDDKMSQIFFDELGIPKPDIYLGVGSGSHAEQTARVMVAFEQVLLEHQPDLVVVVGDVNSTLACSVTAAKLWIPVAHVEAGLRSGDRQMPEEINRLVTDRLSDLLLTTSRDGDEHLLAEGVAAEKIHFVGNVMIDTLNTHKPQAEQLGTPAGLGLTPGNYAVLTMHRPSNVDDPDTLRGLVDAIETIQADIPILFTVHPRTRKNLETFGLWPRIEAASQIKTVGPLGYLAILDLMIHARFVLSDSGGIQEETTCLGIPCLTMRNNTERPITVTDGTNIVIGNDPKRIVAAVEAILSGDSKAGRIPELWDGHAAQRIVDVLLRWWEKRGQ